MRVNVRFLCVDIPIGLGNGDIEVDEGSTIEDVVKYCIEKYKVEMSRAELLNSLFLVNSNPARPDFILNDNDNLAIVRPLHGG